jgi:uncharacterized iron-regulated membrane protein
MSMYPKFRDVHLWVGLILLAPLVVIAATGFMLNHEHALGLKPKKYERKDGEKGEKKQHDRRMASIDKHAIAPPKEAPTEKLLASDWLAHQPRINAALETASARWGKPVSLEKVELKNEPDYGLVVKVMSHKSAGVKPREFIFSADTGEILEEREEGGNWIKELHTGELFHHDWGVIFSDTSAIAILALSVTGIVLYAIPVWKKRQKKKAKGKPVEKAAPVKPNVEAP